MTLFLIFLDALLVTIYATLAISTERGRTLNIVCCVIWFLCLLLNLYTLTLPQ